MKVTMAMFDMADLGCMSDTDRRVGYLLYQPEWLNVHLVFGM